RARTVGAVDDGDIGGGQGHAGIERGDLGVVPLRYVAHEDADQRVAVKHQATGDALDVVSEHFRTGHRRDVQQAGRFGELIIAQRGVGGAEVHRLVADRRDATTRADGLVVEGDVLVNLRAVDL